MKKFMIGFVILALLGITQSAFAEDYNYDLASGWRLDTAVAKKSVSILHRSGQRKTF